MSDSTIPDRRSGGASTSLVIGMLPRGPGIDIRVVVRVLGRLRGAVEHGQRTVSESRVWPRYG